MEEDLNYEEQDHNMLTASVMPGTTNSRQMPIKNKIKECNQDLHENRKNQQIIRTELTQLEHINKEDCNDITAKVLDELERLSRDFKKIVNEEKGENLFLKQQIAQLNQDKVRLEQNILVLKSRVQESESNIGSDQFTEQ